MLRKLVVLITIFAMLLAVSPSAFAAPKSGWDFDVPLGIATDANGKLYVADSYNHRVQVLNSDESVSMTLGVKDETGTDNGHFNVPKAVAVDDTGDIYVLDSENNRIQVFNSQGNWLRTFPLPITSNPVPEAMAIDASGHLFVSDTNYNQVYRLDTDGSNYVQVTGTLADRPVGVAVDSMGNVYISQYWNHTVLVYQHNNDNSYSYLKTFGVTSVSGTDNSHFNNPWGLYVDSSGRLYVTDRTNKRVQVFNSDGSYALTLANPGLNDPRFSISDSSGNIYVLNQSSSQVFLFNAQGTFVKILGQNTAPTFVGNSTTLTVDQNAGATDIKSLLRVSDTDLGQTVTWTQSSAPSHGTLSLVNATASSGSTDIAPGGTITYTPTSGYSGFDSFRVQVSDGTATATRTITVTVNAAPTYTLTYAAGANGTIAGNASQTVNGGASGTAVTAVPNTGYHFASWSDGGTAAIRTDTNVTANVNVTASFEIDTYTISFDSNGGSPVEDQDVTYNTYASEPTVPVRNGYVFEGWYQDSDLTMAFDFSSSAVESDMTLFAKWTPVLSPGAPELLPAVAGNAQVSLTWNPVIGSTGYKIYQSAASDSYGSEVATVSGTVYSYDVTGLQNGTTYYFIVQATNPGGDSAASNQVSATPRSISSAPTNVSAIAGDGQATVTFTAPTDNGGSAITGYEVTASPGNIIMNGTVSPITLTGLSNGTSYTFTVKAINGAGSSASSAESNEVVPRLASVPIVSTTPETPNTSAGILFNGKVEDAGTATTTKVNDQTVTTVVIDQKKLDDMLAAEGQQAVVTILANAKSDVTVGELNGQMVKNMEDKQAVLEIKTDRATYTIPAQQININAISDKVGKSVALQDIKVQIEIAAPTADTVTVVENAAAKGTFTIAVPPLNFTVRGVYGDKSIEISKFSAYVERTIAIPDGVDPDKITTGVVVDPDGTVHHVPTKVVKIDGKYYAQVNSVSNSTYTIVWNPLEFSDVANHWAKEAVNDMGSRMVIDGTGGGMFSPNRDITRAEFAAIIVRGLGLKLENGETPFSDVQAEDWYSSAVNTAYAYRLISGVEDGTFHPNDKITREQAMVIIAKAMTITNLKDRLPVQSTDAALRPYADAAEASTWALSSIADSVQAGIITGKSNTELAPKDYMTRAEVASIVQRLLQKSELI